jgi:hypothetical protein
MLPSPPGEIVVELSEAVDPHEIEAPQSETYQVIEQVIAPPSSPAPVVEHHDPFFRSYFKR